MPAGRVQVLAAALGYHRREAKPGWWRHFEWRELPPGELRDDARTLGGLRRSARTPFKAAPRKRRLAYEFELDEQA